MFRRRQLPVSVFRRKRHPAYAEKQILLVKKHSICDIFPFPAEYFAEALSAGFPFGRFSAGNHLGGQVRGKHSDKRNQKIAFPGKALAAVLLRRSKAGAAAEGIDLSAHAENQ